MGTLQKNNKRKTRKFLFHVRPDWINGIKLAHRSSLGKSKPWSISEVRLKSLEATMLPLQYKSRGKWSRLLQKNAPRSRPGKNGGTGKGQAKDS